ncbi:MAG TPA: hypothetical protein VLC49_08090 [Solirubrobacteraceae bacterium]|nr:hypothetical protein [Solirubrobacteraceae bacterium]
MRLTAVVVLGCALLAACGSTGQPSGTATGAANGVSGDKTSDFEFAQCMRTHGVTNFPDPTAGGGIQLPTNLNPESPAFRSARLACKQFLPNKGAPPATSAADRAAALTLARCMRSHGVPQFPDPAFTPPRNTQRVLVLRGMVFAIPASVDPKAPAFQHAARACGFGL